MKSHTNTEALAGLHSLNNSTKTVPEQFAYYLSHSDTRPAKYLSFDELEYLVTEPTLGAKAQAALLTPFVADGKTKAHADTAPYWAIVIDHDNDDLSRDQLQEKYSSFGVQLLAFTTSSHQQQDERHPTKQNRWKVVIPLAVSGSVDQVIPLSQGLSYALNGDSAQARKQQGFYAPNKLTADAPYEWLELDGKPLDINDNDHPLIRKAWNGFQSMLDAEEAKAKAATAKPHTDALTSNQSGIIGRVRYCDSMANVLTRHGYKKRGRAYLSPHSQSGAAGVYILKGKAGEDRVYSHHGEADLLSSLNHNGHSLDLLDVLTALEYGGNMTRALADLANKIDPDGQKQRQQEYMAAKEAAQTMQSLTESGSLTPQPEAADIFGNLEPPHFPVSLMPNVIGDYARDQADLMGVDPAIICMSAIGALAGCIDDRLQIQPKRHDPTWRESARLWVGIIGDPSAKKSPAISKALNPARAIAAKWREKYDTELAKWEAKCREIQSADKKATLPPTPQLQRLTASDVTVEKLGDILSKCEPRGIIIDRDELNGWLASIDAYKSGAGGKDKAAWLESYNGGGLGIDRIGRGSLWVENWSACIIGGIQPDVIHNYAGATNHDGLLQRFMLIHARQAGRGRDRAPDMAAKSAYTAVFEHLTGLVIEGVADVVTLTEAAHEAREAFNEKLHKAITSMPNKHLTAMLGKWEGTFARLLLTFHCVDCAVSHKHPSALQVSEQTAHKVADLMWRVLLPHAVKFYDGMDDTENNARALAALLLAKGWDRFTCRRDLNNNMLAWRKMRDWQRDEMLDRLEAYGWIYPEIGKLNERGKPSAYLVNSAIYSRFSAQAEAERERRAEVVKIMQELKTG